MRTSGQICMNNLRSSNTLALFFPLLWAVLAQSGSIGTAFPFLIVLWQLTIDEKNCKKEKNILNHFYLNKVSKLNKKNVTFPYLSFRCLITNKYSTSFLFVSESIWYNSEVSYTTNKKLVQNLFSQDSEAALVLFLTKLKMSYLWSGREINEIIIFWAGDKIFYFILNL